jgi:hypothetical protein
MISAGIQAQLRKLKATRRPAPKRRGVRREKATENNRENGPRAFQKGASSVKFGL